MMNNSEISCKHQAVFDIIKDITRLNLVFLILSLIVSCKNHDYNSIVKNQPANHNNSNYSSCIPANYELGNFDKKQISEYYKCRQNMARKNSFSQKPSKINNQLTKCLEDARTSLINQELNEKITCKRKSFEIFPNSLSFEDNLDNEEKRLNLTRVKLDADYGNFNNFTAIGIDDDAFGAAEQKTPTKSQKPKKETKNGIYSISQINQLRHKFLLSCYDDFNIQIIKSNNDLINECYKQFK